MHISIRKFIKNSETELGFLFTKRENTHLLALCDYFDERTYDQLQASDIEDIDAQCPEGDGTVQKNKRILWRAIKDWAQQEGALLPAMQKLGAMFALLAIPAAEEGAAKPRNLEFAKAQAQCMLQDADFGYDDIKALILTIQHLRILPEELYPIWSSLANPIYKPWLDNIDHQEVEPENAIKVSRYTLIIALSQLNVNTDALEHFHKVVNQRRHQKNEDLIPFYLWLGFKSFIDRPVYWWVDCQYGKVKTKGAELYHYRAFIFGGFIVFKSLFEKHVVQLSEIKDLGLGLDAVNDVKFISFKVKGERNAHRISNIETKEDFDFLYSYLSNIPIPGTTEIDRMVVVDDDSTYPQPASPSTPVAPPASSARNTKSANKGNSSEPSNKQRISPIEELESLIGINDVKEQIKSLSNLIKVQQMRKSKGMQAVQVSLHSVFTGAPGTGKTTVARLYAGILKELGILKKGHLVEVDRTELVAGYLGQTAMKTEGIINQAMDGVLFIDEAYSLAPQNAEDSYGEEAVNVLLKRMEDDRDRLVVIVAGYAEEMHQFIDSNPGLSSRFSRYIEFPNYSASDLLEIFTNICEKNEYSLGEGMADALTEHFAEKVSKADKKFGNARYARNLFEKLLEKQSNRVAIMENPSETDISTLTSEDLRAL